MKQNRDLTNRNWILRHCGLDERAWSCEVHIHQEAVAVYPAGVRGRLLELPREVCTVSTLWTKRTVRGSDRGAEVSRGHSRRGNELGGIRTQMDSPAKGPNGSPTKGCKRRGK